MIIFTAPQIKLLFSHNVFVSCRLFGQTLRRLGVAGPTTRRTGNIGIDHPETLKLKQSADPKPFLYKNKNKISMLVRVYTTNVLKNEK